MFHCRAGYPLLMVLYIRLPRSTRKFVTFFQAWDSISGRDRK
jgi:hypothetical protein